MELPLVLGGTKDESPVVTVLAARHLRRALASLHRSRLARDKDLDVADALLLGARLESNDFADDGLSVLERAHLTDLDGVALEADHARPLAVFGGAVNDDDVRRLRSFRLIGGHPDQCTKPTHAVTSRVTGVTIERATGRDAHVAERRKGAHFTDLGARHEPCWAALMGRAGVCGAVMLVSFSFACSDADGPAANATLLGGAGNGKSSAGNTAERHEAACTKGTKRYGTLGYVECTPSLRHTQGAQDKRPGLVIAMHGYTQGVEGGGDKGGDERAWGFKPTSQWAVLAERFNFYVLFPDKGTQAFSWYSYFGTSGIGRSDLEPQALAQMTKDAILRHGIDPARVFVNGLSAGAYMTVVMLATYPDLFAAGATFAGGAYGCSVQCAALGRKGQGWTFPGNHDAALVKKAYPTVWNDAAARKPRLLVFQGDADGAVTPENMADLTQQWLGASGVPSSTAMKSALKGHELVTYGSPSAPSLVTVLMKGAGHGTPVDPGGGNDQGGWDPEPSVKMASDQQSGQDWTNSTGIYGPYYAAKFFGLVD